MAVDACDQIVREQLQGFLASAALRDQPIPRFIEQGFAPSFAAAFSRTGSSAYSGTRAASAKRRTFSRTAASSSFS
jgi:hypothetical protein